MKKFTALLLAIVLLSATALPVCAAEGQIQGKGYIGYAGEPPEPGPDPEPEPTPDPKPDPGGDGGNGTSPYTGEGAIGFSLLLIVAGAAVWLLWQRHKKTADPS